MSRIDEIRAREQAATPGPIEITKTLNYTKISSMQENKNNYVALFSKEDDAIFYSHAREDIPFLLDEISRLSEQVMELANAYEKVCAELAGYRETEQDGRLVMFPIEIKEDEATWFYYPETGSRISASTGKWERCIKRGFLSEIVFNRDNPKGYMKIGVGCYYNYHEFGDIGKTIFLTSEEAEAALQRDKPELEG